VSAPEAAPLERGRYEQIRAEFHARLQTFNCPDPTGVTAPCQVDALGMPRIRWGAEAQYSTVCPLDLHRAFGGADYAGKLGHYSVARGVR
jgi:hypothetical protein